MKRLAIAADADSSFAQHVRRSAADCRQAIRVDGRYDLERRRRLRCYEERKRAENDDK